MNKLLVLLVLFFSNFLQGANFMMNCVSLDFKDTAFYKYQINSDTDEKKLLNRPMKTKWRNFCESNYDFKVSCTFTDKYVERISINNNEKNKPQSIYQLDFEKYQLVKKILEFKNNRPDKIIKTVNYKCRKIKI